MPVRPGPIRSSLHRSVGARVKPTGGRVIGGHGREHPSGGRLGQIALPALIGALLIFMLGCQSSGTIDPDFTASSPRPEILAAVLDVIDGDTIEVEIDGRAERVRYIGMDTPEIGERCAAEATDANGSFVSGTDVRLVPDAEDRDIYGRRLRYVYAGDRFVNLSLVEAGLARPLRILPNDAHSQEMTSAASTARKNGTGCLWDPDLIAAEKRALEQATPSPTPAERIIVERFNYNAGGNDADNLNDEYVIMINLGEDLQIEGWTVGDRAGHLYRFRSHKWRTGTRITLRTGPGFSQGGVFHWDSGLPIWNNDGDELILLDDTGRTILVYAYGG